jgi:hypothetical protein
MWGMVQQRLCLTCSSPFEVELPSSRKYCGLSCWPAQTHSRSRRQPVTVQCAHCGKDFERKAWEVEHRRKKGWALYCSTDCRDDVKRGRRGSERVERVTLTCPMCQREFKLAPWEAKHRTYCSGSCAKRANAGRPRGRKARRVTKEGYVLVRLEPAERPPERAEALYHLEHRAVMAKMLGRWPTPDETVHHVNGDRSDNRPENLQLRSGQHGKGHVLRCRCCGASDIEYVEL